MVSIIKQLNLPFRELVKWMKAEWEAAGIETVATISMTQSSHDHHETLS